ncbi:MAG: hypothetical protein FWE12_03965 [Oscillospiraceae bacterium]|nr:hypothetical protein [Oscillospiraceae bacterium]
MAVFIFIFFMLASISLLFGAYVYLGAEKFEDARDRNRFFVKCHGVSVSVILTAVVFTAYMQTFMSGWNALGYALLGWVVILLGIGMAVCGFVANTIWRVWRR